MLRELNIHHSGTDGLLLTLDDQKGYGKLTAAGCGGDRLAQRMIEVFATRTSRVPVSPALRRDDVGYLPLSIDISHVYPQILSYPASIRDLISRQYRKHVLAPIIGEVIDATIVKVSAKGTVLTIRNPNGSGATSTITALAPFDKPAGGEEAGASVEARVVDYDAQTGALTVSLNAKGKEGAAKVPESLSFKSGTSSGVDKYNEAFQYVRPGDVVECVVILSSNDDGATVVETRIPKVTRPTYHIHTGDCCHDESKTSQTSKKTSTKKEEPEMLSIIGYVANTVGDAAKSTAASLPIGTKLQCVVEFCPSTPAFAGMTPFLVLSKQLSRQSALRIPLIFEELAASTSTDGKGVGLVGRFAWREGKESKIGGKRGRDGEEGEDAMRKRKLEEAIDAYERQTNVIPTSPDEFTKMLLSNPNSSYLWTQFMAFHTGLQQIEQARQVAEKALRTIGVREAKEHQNVWVAYMNLENLHGTAESLASVFKRACQHSDNTLVLHEKLADIFKSTKRHQQELQLCRSMVSRFRDNSKVWERLGICLLEQDKRDQLKRLLKDMSSGSSILNKSDQFMVMEHLAIHEYRREKVDSGRAMFESLVLKAPRKSDLWQAYIDQELSLLGRKSTLASVPTVRQIFERLTTVQFSPKVMQQFLTRFLTFEQTYGSAADVEKVKAKAREYVSSRLAATGGADGSV